MRKIYRTALGKQIDMDQLRIANEQIIAVGNMKVNARGDELGPGGEVRRSRNEVMNEYYQITAQRVQSSEPETVDESVLQRENQQQSNARPQQIRGSLADNIIRGRKILDDQDGEQ